MKGLERFPEPWAVEDRGDGRMVVKDARGFTLLSLGACDDLKRFEDGQNGLNSTEAFALARAIARLPELSQRPQY